MATRAAACHCGQLELDVTGEPFAVSICHCLDCQRRTGSAFGMQAGFKADQVSVTGRYDDFTRISDESDRKAHVFHFCPDCGVTVCWARETGPTRFGIPVGTFNDPAFPAPSVSFWEQARYAWSPHVGDVKHWDTQPPPA